MMIVGRLRARLRARAAGSDDGGFALVYVLLVSMLIMVGVSSMMVVTASNLVPARHSQDDDAALAAANAGIQDAIAWLNSSGGCPQRGTRCDGALGKTGTNTRTGTDVLQGSGESFQWSFQSAYVTDDAGNTYLRVSSTGSAGSASKKLVADVEGITNLLDYEYYSTYETMGSKDLNNYLVSRDIPISCSTANAANTSTSALTSGTCSGTSMTAHWNGAATSSPSDTVCDKLWYDSAAYNGAAAVGRYTTEEQEPTLPQGMDWGETGTVNGTSVPTHYAPCQLAFTTGMSFDGPVYTVDAPLLSKGTPSGAGPSFAKAFNTPWSSANTPAAPARPYRSDPFVGAAYTGHAPSRRSNAQTLSSTFNPAVPTGACVFSGPTRVYLNGDGTATVTSPQTTSPGCTATKTTGQPVWTVDYAHSAGNGVIYVKKNGTAASRATGQRATDTPDPSRSVFYLSNSASGTGSLDTSTVTSPDPNACSSSNRYTTSGSTCQWSSTWSSAGSSWAQDGTGWTKYSSGTNCTKDGLLTTAPANDRLTFECEFNGGSVGNPHDIYSTFRQRVYDAIRNNSYTSHGVGTCANNTFNPASASGAQLACLVQDFLQVANTNSAVANSTSTPSAYAHQYIVKATAGPTTVTTQAAHGAGSAPSVPISGDPLFTNQTGTGPQETKTVTTTLLTAYRQSAVCSALNLAGACIGTWSWGNDTPQFQISVPQTVYSNLTSGTPSISYFPNLDDVTQYATGSTGANGSDGPGDVYVEGRNAGKLSLLADGNAVVTGNITSVGTGSAMDVDTLGGVRLFHPVQCVTAPTTGTNPTAGFCPNDLTGLYSGGLASHGALLAAHPAMQYCNMLTGLTANTGNPNSCAGTTATGTGAITEIDAALVAQGGSFSTYNYDRAVGLGNLTINGGLYQLHRGALGVQWEVQSTDASSRASSGARLQMTYVNLTNSGLSYVPAFSGASPNRYWNVVSVSSPGG